MLEVTRTSSPITFMPAPIRKGHACFFSRFRRQNLRLTRARVPFRAARLRFGAPSALGLPYVREER